MSNKGDKIAFLSDKEDYFDIYIASSIDRKILKKVVRGQRAGNLEELHWLRGRGIGWSPDDKKLVFSAKAGAEDQLHIVDIKKEKIIQSYDLGFDGIYNPTWSPVENKIAFMGIKKGLSDIYIYNIDTDKLFKVTSDMFSDTEPAWSPDGKKLIFSSDRGDYIDTIPENFKPTDINMKNYDIYEINTDGTGLKKITGTEFLERSPVYSPDGKYITFSSDRSGVSNIYIKNMETSEEWPITNVLTGAFLPTWGGKANRLAFSSFYYAGYDVYLLKNPLEIEPGSVEVEETHYIKSLREQKEAETQVADESVLPSEGQFAFDKNKKKYRNFIFDEDFKNAELAQKHKQVFLDSADYALPTGEFKVHEYQVKFSPDLVYGSVGYNQFFGTQGYTNILLSDVMGDHRINLALNLFGDFRNADYAATYLYLPKKIDYGVGVYHNAYFFYSNSLGWVRDRNYGISFHMSNPFNRYTRLSYGLALMGISRTYMDRPDDEIDYYIDNGWISPRNRFFVLNNLTYTKDTTIWGYTGPTNGKRYAIGITSSPKLGDKGIQFTTIRADWRSYHRLTRNYIIALRGAGGISLGKNPQKFFVGGLSNWINYKYDGGIRVNNIEEIYFASFEMPLRGAYYYGLEGTRYLLSNIEFRFPLVHHLKMGFPLPLEFYEIGGALFVDVGVAWERDAVFKPFVKSPNNIPQLNVDNGIDGFDAYASIGFGPRVNLGIFLLRLDLAWPTDFYHTEKSPIVLWSLGADF